MRINLLLVLKTIFYLPYLILVLIIIIVNFYNVSKTENVAYLKDENYRFSVFMDIYKRTEKHKIPLSLIFWLIVSYLILK